MRPSTSSSRSSTFWNPTSSTSRTNAPGNSSPASTSRGRPISIEIASTSTRQRDETTKRRRYEQFGVREYWIVDPEIDVVRIYRRAGETFARPIELSRETNDVLTTPLLPGLEIPLARVFGN